MMKKDKKNILIKPFIGTTQKATDRSRNTIEVMKIVEKFDNADDLVVIMEMIIDLIEKRKLKSSEGWDLKPSIVTSPRYSIEEIK